MLVSEQQEIQIDQQYAPMQFSADYGPVQDRSLNNYIDRVGKNMAAKTHRPQMPYSFRVVNATYVNAYAFPAGSIAATRGIMLKLDNEAELAALLGHELGHVNARHTAERMTTGTITQTLVGIVAAYAGSQDELYGQIAATLGMIGSGMLLASYSRDNEREADNLGMEYSVTNGYSPEGMVGLMEMLNSLRKGKPSAIELMFSTHPWSQERLQSMTAQARGKYGAARRQPLHRERYMDNTARLRAKKDAIEKMQTGDGLMAHKKYDQALDHYKTALRSAPDDYAGLTMMAKCLLMKNNNSEGLRYAREANSVYPQEGQAIHLKGMANLRMQRFEPAYQSFSRYDKMLPGNPMIEFYKGYTLEKMGRREQAAKNYYNFLQQVQKGKEAEHAYKRLVSWGYIKQNKK
jgi:predicted Zn-dependent protease